MIKMNVSEQTLGLSFGLGDVGLRSRCDAEAGPQTLPRLASDLLYASLLPHLCFRTSCSCSNTA